MKKWSSTGLASKNVDTENDITGLKSCNLIYDVTLWHEIWLVADGWIWLCWSCCKSLLEKSQGRWKRRKSKAKEASSRRCPHSRHQKDKIAFKHEAIKEIKIKYLKKTLPLRHQQLQYGGCRYFAAKICKILTNLDRRWRISLVLMYEDLCLANYNAVLIT